MTRQDKFSKEQLTNDEIYRRNQRIDTIVMFMLIVIIDENIRLMMIDTRQNIRQATPSMILSCEKRIASHMGIN
jgi:hypothetical protein